TRTRRTSVRATERCPLEVATFIESDVTSSSGPCSIRPAYGSTVTSVDGDNDWTEFQADSNGDCGNDSAGNITIADSMLTRTNRLFMIKDVLFNHENNSFRHSDRSRGAP